MKKLFILALVLIIPLSLSLLGGGLAYFAPYLIFSKAVEGKLHHEYLSLEKASPQLLFPKRFKKEEMEQDTFGGQENLWGNFHFQNFIVPLPLRHPYFNFVPNVLSDERGLKMGARFLQPRSREEFASFMTGEIFSLDTEVGAQKIFNLPYFKSYIEQKAQAGLWEDLFTLDVTAGIKINQGQMSLGEIIDETKKFWGFSLQDWVYRLFLLEKRLKFFPGEIQMMDYKPLKKIGIAKKVMREERYLRETYYLLVGKEVYTLNFAISPWDNVAKATRKKFLENLEVKRSSTDDSIAIYNSYLQLPYESRVDQEGLTYLFCAWSHQPASKDYLRLMIKFLEKGKDNALQIAPLYEYAYKRFGSNFSTREESLQEDVESRLKRKMGEELERELTEAEKKEYLDAEGKFQSDEAKMKFFLNKAKEKGVNSDKNESSLDL